MKTYSPLSCKVGEEVECARHGRVIVTGFNRQGFPLCRVGGIQGCARSAVILAGGLVDAVREESCRTVARLAGVHRDTVTVWRQALGVARMNPGTIRAFRRATKKRRQWERSPTWKKKS